MSKKLYMVTVSMEADINIPVFAGSKEEAGIMAQDAIDMNDVDFETWTRASEVEKCPKYFKNEIPEGSEDGKTCEDIFNEVNRENLQYEMEESWPKLPGFSEVTL